MQLVFMLMFYGNTNKKEKVEEFCDGCCYNNHPQAELECDMVKCCYLVKKKCIIKREKIV